MRERSCRILVVETALTSLIKAPMKTPLNYLMTKVYKCRTVPQLFGKRISGRCMLFYAAATSYFAIHIHVHRMGGFTFNVAELVAPSLIVLGYLESSLQERTIPIADNMAANPIKTAKSNARLFMPVAPIKSCLVASLA